MDPITAAISAFSPTNIFLAGAALIALVITIVGIDKVRDMINGEAVDAYMENGSLYRDHDEDGDTFEGLRYRLDENGEWSPALSAEKYAETVEELRQEYDDKYEWYLLTHVHNNSDEWSGDVQKRYYDLAYEYDGYEFDEEESFYFAERASKENQ